MTYSEIFLVSAVTALSVTIIPAALVYSVNAVADRLGRWIPEPWCTLGTVAVLGFATMTVVLTLVSVLDAATP